MQEMKEHLGHGCCRVDHCRVDRCVRAASSDDVEGRVKVEAGVSGCRGGVGNTNGVGHQRGQFLVELVPIEK